MYALPFWLQCTFLSQIGLAVNQNPQICFPGAALQPLILRSAHVAKVAPSHVQNLALVLVGMCSWHQAFQSSRSVWTMLLDIGFEFWMVPRVGLDDPCGPFQLGMFYVSLILWFQPKQSPACNIQYVVVAQATWIRGVLFFFYLFIKSNMEMKNEWLQEKYFDMSFDKLGNHVMSNCPCLLQQCKTAGALSQY